MSQEYLNGKVVVVAGNIVQIKADAIVNAANSSLMGGGGVDGAIHRAGGPRILEECGNIRKDKYPQGLPAGEAVETTGGLLPVRYVIHTVGPVWHGGNANEDSILANSYKNSIRLAEKSGCKTIAFPAISTGVYGFPPERAARIVSRVLKESLADSASLERVILVFFSPQDYEIFLENQEF